VAPPQTHVAFRGVEGSFDADALQVAGIPFANITTAGGRVHFELAGDKTTAIFDGAVAHVHDSLAPGWPRHTPSYADHLIRWVLARK